MMLPCELTPDEWLERQGQLVGSTQSRELREQALVMWKAERKAEEEVLKADISHVANDCFRLAKIIKARSEPREVEVVDELEKAEVVSYRTDTGELISRRAAVEHELQKELPI
jgi:hypothetical protein